MFLFFLVISNRAYLLTTWERTVILSFHCTSRCHLKFNRDIFVCAVFPDGPAAWFENPV